jgi:hypothetical protein
LPYVIVMRYRQEPDAAQFALGIREPGSDLNLPVWQRGAERGRMPANDVAMGTQVGKDKGDTN